MRTNELKGTEASWTWRLALGVLGSALALILLQATANADAFQITSTLGTGTFSTVGVCNQSQQVNCTLATFGFPFIYGDAIDPSAFTFTDGVNGPSLDGSTTIPRSCAFGACWWGIDISPGSTPGTVDIFEWDAWAGPTWNDPSATISPFTAATPEPSTMFLLGSSFLGFFGVVRQKFGKRV